MQLYYCGFNGFGQCLVNTDAISKTVYSDFIGCPLDDIVDIDFCWSYCVLLNRSGSVYLSGFTLKSDNELIKLGVPSDSAAVKVSCCSSYIIVVTQCGECWQYMCSDESWKKLVNFASTETTSCNSKIIKFLCCGRINVALSDTGIVYNVPSPLPVPDEKVIDIACGLEHSILLTESGKVFTWGTGTRGQLGHGEVENEELPREVDALSGLKVTCIAAGGWHCACVTSEGDLYTWGWNCSGQLGQCSGAKRVKKEDGQSAVTVQTVPVPVEWADEDIIIKEVACGTSHTLALAQDGSLWGCGWNGYGQLGMPVDSVTNIYTMNKLDTCPRGEITKLKCGAWNSAVFISSANE